MENNDQLIKVKLNRKIESGAEASLFFDCEASIPLMVDVYGIARDGEIQMPFFYPILAVYDSYGWDIQPMDHDGERRYAEVSDYSLCIEAPSDYEIVCSGNEVSRETKNGATTYSFVAEKRRDIIFCAYTDYVKMERIVDNTRLLGFFNVAKSPVAMAHVMDTAAFALEYFSRVYMEYPYDTLIITNTAWGI